MSDIFRPDIQKFPYRTTYPAAFGGLVDYRLKTEFMMDYII